MTLQDAIQIAAEMAYEEDADQYVVRGDDREWLPVHSEDPRAFAPGITDRFLVDSDGVDRGHIARGEITEEWELPEIDEDEELNMVEIPGIADYILAGVPTAPWAGSRQP